MSKRLRVALTVSLLFLVLLRFKYFWERYPGGLWNVLFYLGILTLFLWILVKLILEAGYIISNRKQLNWKFFMPMLIMIVALLDGFYNPLRVDPSRIFQGEVVFRACFEGTQNQATFKLFDKNTFELHWTGAFFYDEFFTGTYQQKADSLFLTYSGRKPVRFTEKVYMDNGKQQLMPVRNAGDTLSRPVPFYYGYCKGLN